MNDNENNMSNEFKDVETKKNTYVIIVIILYLFVILLTILLILGIRNQRDTVKDSLNTKTNAEDGVNYSIE